MVGQTRRYAQDSGPYDAQDPALRAHVRPKKHEDERVLLVGEYVSRAEMNAYTEYRQNLGWWQLLVSQGIRWKLLVRHSFIHGTLRKYLTYLAVYAAGCELIHDLHLPDLLCLPHEVGAALELVQTKHAVGLMALAHLAENIKERLEDRDKPAHHLAERQRLDMIRIYGTKEADPTWPRHIRYHHATWAAARGDVPPFPFQ